MSPRRNDSAMALDVADPGDDDRRACPGQTPVPALDSEPKIEPARSRRCDDAHRELYRHHFPPR